MPLRLDRALLSTATLLLTLLVTSAASFGQQQFFRSLTVDGDARRYLVYLPTGFDPAENMPVMMWFHGGGGTANEALNWEADFRSLANSERFIAVYPEAFPDVLEGCRCWGYDLGGETNGNYEKDLEYTSAVIADLVTTYNADSRRIYAGGYSMGASFCWDLACAKSDEIAAIAPVAANMYMWTFENCDAAAPTAVCHILGTNDFYAPYNGSVWSPSVAAQNAFWVAKNEADPKPETESLGGGVTRYTWAPGPGCHGVQHFRRQGGGHDVPNFATTSIWSFVSAYDIDGSLACNPVEPPSNDECADAIDLAEGSFAFTTEGATDSGIDSSLSCSASGGPQVDSDIWFRFIAPCTGTMTISTCGTTFDSRLDVYNATCPTSGDAPYACSDDDCGDDAVASNLVFEGQVLLIRVGSRDGSSGEGTLEIACDGFEPPNPADLNGDGIVDSADLGLLVAAWNTPNADLNGDGTTNSADLGLLIAEWS